MSSTTGRSAPRPALILGICCMSLFIVGLDNTILNVALPALSRDLGASIAGLQWTVDAYTLVLAMLLMLGGSTADRLGRRLIFRVGLAIFGVSSLLCGLSGSLGLLVAFRALQGVGGAMLNPVAMSIITNVYTERRARARAIGVWAAVAGISLALGPVIGGLLVDSVSWRAIFWVNVPVAALALVLTTRFVPESRAPRPRRVDPAGQLLVIGFLGGLTAAIIEAPDRGWGSPLVLGLLAVALAALLGLLAYEPRREDPLIDLRFFRSAPFSGASVIAICGFGVVSGFLFLNTLYLQDVRGYSPLRAGLLTLPMPLMGAVFAPVAGRLVGSRGTRIPLVLSGVCMTAAAVSLSFVDAGTPLARLIASYVVLGIGFGFLNAPITNTAVSGMPVSQAGVAAAVASTSRQIGQSTGVAVIGSMVAGGLGGAAVGGTALVSAAHGAWWVVAGFALAVLVIGLVTSGAWAHRTAEATAARLDPAEDRPVSSGTPSADVTPV